jgi:hypothetical protein
MNKYPAILRLRDTINGEVKVLFRDETSGTVIESTDSRYPINFFSQEWTSAENGTIWEKLDIDMESIISSGEKEKNTDVGTKYKKTVQSTEIDVYDVLVAYDVTNPAIQHAIKKLLMPGLRGHKNVLSDLREAQNSIKRAIEIEKQKG